jgi:DNA-binding CsgD family transcriptional regulator
MGLAPAGHENDAVARLLHAVMRCDVTTWAQFDPDLAAAGLTTWRDLDAAPACSRHALAATVAEEFATWSAGALAVTELQPHGVVVAGTRYQLGIRLLAPGLQRRLDEAGRHRPRIERPPSPGPDVASLTPRERDVLELVGRGLTSQASARRLGISRRTVTKHLEHAYAKLGCRDRVSAVLRLRAALPEAE